MAFSDNFNRANGAIGSPWTNITGEFSIQNNRAYCSSPTSILNCATVVDAGSRNYSAEVLLYGIADSYYGDGLAIAMTDANNYILFMLAGLGPSLVIYRYIAGEYTFVDNAAVSSIADGVKLRVVVANTTYQVYVTPYNGSESMIWSTINQLSEFTGTLVGLVASNHVAGGVGSGSTFDNFAWTSTGGGPVVYSRRSSRSHSWRRSYGG